LHSNTNKTAYLELDVSKFPARVNTFIFNSQFLFEDSGSQECAKYKLYYDPVHNLNLKTPW
jgi:hypothetical protein